MFLLSDYRLRGNHCGRDWPIGSGECLLDTYLKQIFEDVSFTPIPSRQLFVNTGPRRIRLAVTFVDFGMVGHVPDSLRTGLREVLISVGTQDAGPTDPLLPDNACLLPNTIFKQLEQMSASMFDRFWGKSMDETAGDEPEKCSASLTDSGTSCTTCLSNSRKICFYWTDRVNPFRYVQWP